MMTTTIAALTDVLPALTTCNQGSTKTRRAGQRVRMYRPELTVVQTPALASAIATLVSNGYEVRVYEDRKVYYPSLHGDCLVWSTRETSKKRDYSCIEVSLAKSH